AALASIRPRSNAITHPSERALLDTLPRRDTGTVRVREARFSQGTHRRVSLIDTVEIERALASTEQFSPSSLTSAVHFNLRNPTLSRAVSHHVHIRDLHSHFEDRTLDLHPVEFAAVSQHKTRNRQHGGGQHSHHHVQCHAEQRKNRIGRTSYR